MLSMPPACSQKGLKSSTKPPYTDSVKYNMLDISCPVANLNAGVPVV